ncbi:MAG: hypothetical protein ACREP6_07380, partial [Candidatus Binataceae bacterium]
ADITGDERWRHWARRMRSLLNLAAAIESGEAGESEDWKNILPVSRQFADSAGRPAVAAAATSLLAAAPLRLRMVLESERYALKLGPAAHF